MDKKGVIAFIFVFVFVSNTCNASSSFFRLRKLIDGESNNATVTPKVSPTGSPANETKTNPINAGDSEEEKPNESPIGNQTNSNNTPPTDSKNLNKTDSGSKSSDAPSPPAGVKNDTIVDRESGKAANESTSKLGNNGSCKGSRITCRDQQMFACIEASKDGSKKMFVVVQNEGEITLKVTLSLPNYLKNDMPAVEVPKHESNRIDVSSNVGKSTELIVDSGKYKCVLQLVHPVSVDNLIQQLSFYSKQVTPIYIVYTSFLIALLFGGTWACCKLKKRNQQDGIPYQELEMGLPESASAANVDATEGWDHDWDDDDDWDEDNSVKSPIGNQVRIVSAEAPTARPSKKDGWEDDWED
ncbi:hypothetical protein ACP275_10G003800 [Erythranthe tilingii]